MKCPYPDCQGDVTANDAFCGECGRSVAPAAVQQFLSTYRGPIQTNPQPTPQPKPQPNRMPLFLGGGAVLIVLVLIFGVGSVVANMGNSATPTPRRAATTTALLFLPTSTVETVATRMALPTNTPRIPTATPEPTEPIATETPVVEFVPQTFSFSLNELDADNNYVVAKDVRAADGTKLGVISFDGDWQYTDQGNPELMGSLQIKVNNTNVLELTTSDQAMYAEANPAYEVAKEGATYDKITKEGWAVLVTVDSVTLDQAPMLSTGVAGGQPAYKTLLLHVDIATGAAGAALFPTFEPGSLATSFNFGLSDLNVVNKYVVAQDLRPSVGDKLGLLTIQPNYSYSSLDAPELIATVEIRINNELVLELAASNQPEYTTSNPGFEVAEVGKTYTKTTKDGWQVKITVLDTATVDKPTLPSGSYGNQPVFTTLDLSIDIDTVPVQ